MKTPAELDADIPPYNPRLVRRATRRGLARSAFRVIVILFLGTFVLRVLGGLWGYVGGRQARFQTVAEGAFMVAHPELNFTSGARGGAGLRLNESTELGWSVRTAEGDILGATGSVTLHNSASGNITVSSDTLANAQGTTPLGRGMNGLRPEKAATRRLLAQLPRPVLTMAIVELNAPANPDDFNRRFVGFPPSVGPVYLTDPYVYLDDPHGNPLLQVTWPTVKISAANGTSPFGKDLTSFTQWTAQLRSSDDHNLRKFRLPDAHTLQAMGRAPRVYAFVVQAQTPDQITHYLDDPAVRNVNIVDVAYDLNQSP